MQTSTQYKVGDTVLSQYFGESVIEEIAGKHYLVRALDGRCMYHWTSEFSPMVQANDAVVLVAHDGHTDLVIVVAVSAGAALVTFEDGAQLWVALFHVSQIIARNVFIHTVAAA